MAIKTNWDVAHHFFYQDGHERCNPSWLNCGFDGDDFYSYSTIIAKIVTGLDGRHYTLVSYDNMSPTTGRHISNVVAASPYEVIRVPMAYGYSSFDIKCLEQRISANLDMYAESRLSRKENRAGYINYFWTLLAVNAKIIKISPETIEKYRPLYDTLVNSQSVKELKRNIADNERKQRDALRYKLKTYIEFYSFSQLARIAYDYTFARSNDVSDDVRSAIKKFLNPKNDWAFVWRTEDGNYATSKGIKMPKKIADVALKRFIAKELRHGDKLDYYTILAITDKSVKIGCHNIPIENVYDLYETMEVEG